jgi:AcrR family transcriptional regulator
MPLLFLDKRVRSCIYFSEKSHVPLGTPLSVVGILLGLDGDRNLIGKINPQKRIQMVAEAARRLFVKKGYYNVSIPQIVKESGVSTGAIYSYFPNKEALAHYIHEKTLEDFKEMFMQVLYGKQTTFDKLKSFADLVFDLTENDAEMVKYMLSEHGKFLHESRPLCSTEPFRMVQEIVNQGMKLGEVKQGNYLLSAVSFTGVILRAVDLRLQGVLDSPLSDISEELIGNAWAAIKLRKSD